MGTSLQKTKHMGLLFTVWLFDTVVHCFREITGWYGTGMDFVDADDSGWYCGLSCFDIFQIWQKGTESINLKCMEQTCRLVM